jgi:hypothetical protein
MEQLQYLRVAGSPFFAVHPGMLIAYSCGMARGWESKAVEAQQEEALRAERRRRAATPEQLAVDDRRRTLELMRKRTEDGLSRATVPAHRHMLEQAIASLDTELASLGTAKP